MRERGVFTDGEGITFNWNYTGTKFKPLPGAVNGFTVDTSKSYVDRIFKDVYGYSSEADTWLAVQKPNDTNGFKDCKLVAERREGCFYQKVLFTGNQMKERRVIIMGGVVYSVIKTKQVSLTDLPGKVIKYEIDEGFRDERINQFCKLYPLDYGELDIITFEGKDYIIDVNPTPGDASFVKMPLMLAVKYIMDYDMLFRQYLNSLQDLTNKS